MTTDQLASHIALLRGVNVGGKNKLPMKDLARMFLDAGCQSARTYIQSGNVVFKSDPHLASRIPDLISAAIEAQCGYSVPVVIRSAEELRGVSVGNPYLEAGADPDKLHVAFLAEVPDAQRVASLAPDRSPPDTFQVRGREVFLHCPNGLGRSKLTNTWLDSQLKTVSTLRNWRTVLTLLDMAEGL